VAAAADPAAWPGYGDARDVCTAGARVPVMRMRSAVAAVVLVLVASCDGRSSDIGGGPSQARTLPGLQVPAAARYVRKVAAAAADVQQAVQAAQSGLQSLALNPDGADPGSTAQLAELVQQQRADILSADTTLRVPTARRGPVAAWETEMLLAARDLAAALQALASYLTNPTAAPLTRHTELFATGSSEWNDAVTHLWTAADIPNPPTLSPPDAMA
jgi:hypothetical protein